MIAVDKQEWLYGLLIFFHSPHNQNASVKGYTFPPSNKKHSVAVYGISFRITAGIMKEYSSDKVCIGFEMLYIAHKREAYKSFYSYREKEKNQKVNQKFYIMVRAWHELTRWLVWHLFLLYSWIFLYAYS